MGGRVSKVFVRQLFVWVAVGGAVDDDFRSGATLLVCRYRLSTDMIDLCLYYSC